MSLMYQDVFEVVFFFFFFFCVIIYIYIYYILYQAVGFSVLPGVWGLCFLFDQESSHLTNGFLLPSYIKSRRRIHNSVDISRLVLWGFALFPARTHISL